MEKEKSQNSQIHGGGGGGGGGGGLPPPSMNRYTAFPSSSSAATPSSVSAAPLQQTAELGHHNHNFSNDISGMSDLPRKNLGHRRAHSEILSLPDDISFDSELGVVGGSGNDGCPSDETEDDFFSMYLDIDKFNSAPSNENGNGGSNVGQSSMSNSESLVIGGGGSSERPMRGRHQHSVSMDGSSTFIKPELLMGSGSESGGPLSNEAKKALSAAKLSELALVDPKRAKRIWANRQSAARSKERKMRYISELERKLQSLQSETTTMTTQLALLQRDTSGLAAENSDLKLRLQTFEQQASLQESLNEALKDELQHLKVLTGQGISNGGGPMMNFGGSYYSNNHSMQQSVLTSHQFQQLQIQSQQQQPHQNHIQLQQHMQQFQQQQPSGSGELKIKGGGGSAVSLPSQRNGGGGSSSADSSNHHSMKD
ncbi:hypothetical protein C5167_025887 [Papaver somniferum]|uniref:BZIP domain-containing protein n=1 Tax=Papaver somniferum TaxID=3469 RepID=A0A4Y7JTW7_PAPSO|nr:probable transcription factor PosF21 [Papaver somniferum]XP_026389878.1 probable transcription factor PosF21 [Papaver somniferum]RZC64147.1 hypothetical protein C5167_025887 [Papaver somniferum]